MTQDRQPNARIVRTTDRPEFIPLVAAWRWEAFARDDGSSLEDVQAHVMESIAETGPPQTFVLLIDDQPVGTASFVAHDLEGRAELTPWLASVFVAPEARGRGHAAVLVAAVEAAAQAASVARLWLYTETAEHVYARIGWGRVENFAHHGRPAVLMVRDLSVRSEL